MANKLAALAVALGIALILWLQPSQAQQNMCSPSEVMLKGLAERFKESQFATGTSGPLAMRLLVNKETGSWTLLVFPRPDVACIAAGGEDFAVEEEPLRQGQGT